MSEGIDFSWARPGGAAIRAAGKTFVMRYVPYPGDGGKGLTAAEVSDYRANRLAIGLVFESTASRHLDGRNAGFVDATQSVQSLAALGAPADLPIYFAVDFDAQPNHFAAIDEYQRGAASVIGAARVGVYGSWAVVNHCHSVGTAKWLWQTYAWSGGRLHPQAHLYQYSNGEQLNGEVDFCRSFGTQQGLWVAEGEALNDTRLAAVEAALTGLAGDAAAARLADWNTTDTGDPSGNSLLDGYTQLQLNVAVIALRATGAITEGMSSNEVRALVSEELRKARIVLGG